MMRFRFAAMLLFAFLSFGSLVSQAKAECGMDQYLEGIKYLKQVESVPQKFENITTPNGPGPRSIVSSASINPCPDDSQLKLEAMRIVISAYGSALALQNQAIVIEALKNHSMPGNPPSSCLSFLYPRAQEHVTLSWENFAGSNGDLYDLPKAIPPALYSEMTKMPYFNHIVALWKSDAKRLGLRLPPLTASYAVLSDLEDRYKRATDIASAHAPSGDVNKCPINMF